MTESEKTKMQILLDALQDAEAAFGILEATLRQGKLEPVAEIVRGFRNKITKALADVSRETNFTMSSGTLYSVPEGEFKSVQPIQWPSVNAMKTALAVVEGAAERSEKVARQVSGEGEAAEAYRNAAKCISLAITSHKATAHNSALVAESAMFALSEVVEHFDDATKDLHQWRVDVSRLRDLAIEVKARAVEEAAVAVLLRHPLWNSVPPGSPISEAELRAARESLLASEGVPLS